MDKIIQYQQIIKKIVQNKATFTMDGFTEFEVQKLIDEEHGHYQVLYVGWKESDFKRIYSCLLHVDLKEDKVWIQQDWTEKGVADELIEAGVAKSDIVLAFHAPYERNYTGFSTA